MKKTIKKLLIANRAEIAVRIMKTCREHDIEVHTLYADDDWSLVHAQQADCAHPLGGGPLKETYLNMDKVIDSWQDDMTRANK